MGELSNFELQMHGRTHSINCPSISTIYQNVGTLGCANMCAPLYKLILDLFLCILQI